MSILSRLFESKEAKQKRMEARQLAKEAEQFTHLVASLADTSFSVRKAAAQALGQIGDVRAIAPLIEALNDQYGSVREAAIQALDKLGDARAVEPLMASLKDKDAGVRKAAAEALERNWASESKQALEDYRRSEEEAKREAEEARAKRCMVCSESVNDTGGGKIITTSGDVTAASSDYGQKCDECNAFVHFRCSKLESQRQGRLTVKRGSCPKCGCTLLTLMKA